MAKAIALRGIALAETELGRFGEAVEHAEEAQRLAGLPVEVLMALNRLAWPHARAGGLEAAGRGYREATAARTGRTAGSGPAPGQSRARRDAEAA